MDLCQRVKVTIRFGGWSFIPHARAGCPRRCPFLGARASRPLCKAPIDTLREDLDFIKTLSVWVPLAACPPVRRKHTGSKLPVAPQLHILVCFPYSLVRRCKPFC